MPHSIRGGGRRRGGGWGENDWYDLTDFVNGKVCNTNWVKIHVRWYNYSGKRGKGGEKGEKRWGKIQWG